MILRNVFNVMHAIVHAKTTPNKYLTKPIYWKQGWGQDDCVRMRSSSGGVATAVERAFIKNGGIVCSCTFSFGKFEFDFAETEDEVCKFTGLKYVKSNPEGVYKKILEKFKLGRKIILNWNRMESVL